MELVRESLYLVDISDEYKEAWVNTDVDDFVKLNRHIKKMCMDQKVVLMIDEVDKTSNNRVFLQFLSMLRAKYLARKNGKDHTFHSVILPGVYDIKNIKFKIINEGSYSSFDTEGMIYNSPWNIAARFIVDMSFNLFEIKSMLTDYQGENDIFINTSMISQEIYKYTSGYPFLVSNICKIIDEELDKDWSERSVLEAVEISITRKDTLFDDPIVNLGSMFGYIKNENGRAVVTNRIFETRISNYFISKDSNTSPIKDKIAGVLSRDVIKNNDHIRFSQECK